ncbi:hypothetical protein GA0070560_1232 [Micromonospora halophytica]|uniref:Uncharacterized protein n=1 Tax=Micromonospora halophytica TaxID=47864 RepID=A0A1C5J7M4_9ACTN|nr:hypothetical protein GA0070560_1232 [Micromonospora halophytica]
MSEFFDPGGVSPALVVIWFLIAAMFYANNEELHFRVLAVAMMLMSGTQLLRITRARWAQRGGRRGAGVPGDQNGLPVRPDTRDDNQ